MAVPPAVLLRGHQPRPRPSVHKPRARLPRRQQPSGDLTRWKEHDVHGKALERLLRDRKVEAASQSPAA
jgi:hypothetical protein